jgi:uncharacterized protein
VTEAPGGSARDTLVLLDLLDWRRRISELYREIRVSEAPERAWEGCRAVRDELIRTHPQSPIRDPAQRSVFPGPDYFPYDPAARVLAEVEPAEPERVVIEASADGRYSFTRFGTAAFELAGEACRLSLFWLEGYGGGLFLSFRDLTSGKTTYGACRYLLDTIKGADLGTEGEKLVLDFNFAYQPSCSYDPTWVCPLAPPENRLPVVVEAGERLRT